MMPEATSRVRIYPAGSLFCKRPVRGSRPGDEHGDIEAVADAVDGLAEDEVGNHAVAVRAGDQQVDRCGFELLDELGGGVGAVEEHRVSLVAALAEGLGDFVEVSGVRTRVLVGGLGTEDARDRTSDDVKHNKLGLFRVSECEGAAQDLRVGRAVLERDPDAVQGARLERGGPVDPDGLGFTPGGAASE